MKIVSSLLKLRSGSDQNPYPSKNESAQTQLSLVRRCVLTFWRRSVPVTVSSVGEPTECLLRIPSRRKANQSRIIEE
jgi:hypothetical protein